MSHHQVLPLKNKSESIPVACEYAGGCFRINEKGLTFIGTDKDGNQLPPRWICTPIQVVAKTRDARSGEWGRLLEWQDDDGFTHQWAMPLALLQGDSADVRRELARLGLSISPSKTARDLLASYLQIFPVEDRARCVDKMGWQGIVFVTASEAIGQSDEGIVFQNPHAIEPAQSVAGTIEEWRDTIGQLSSRNSRLIFAISTAFAPPLAKLAGEDSGGFHFRGASSSGKTTALKVAASVWGRLDAYCRLWRSTTNGLEGLAAMHNDGLLILDELSQIDPKEVGAAAYLLANGQGKTRASRHGTVKPSTSWSLLFLSDGEESLSALMMKAGQRANAGQEIRLVDIEADAGMGMGLFENIHNQLSPTTMALSLKDYAGRYYGAVGMAWLRMVVEKQHLIANELAEHLQNFVSYARNLSSSGQIARVARRFGLVAVAGELATEYGFTGWDKGEATSAVQICYTAWLENFGVHGNREERAMLSQVRAFFESFGASRFDSVNAPNDERIQNRAGFYRTDDQGFRVYMLLAEVFKNEVCQGFDPKTVAKVLLNDGWIESARDGSPSQKPRIKGVGTPRLCVFTNQIWDGE